MKFILLYKCCFSNFFFYNFLTQNVFLLGYLNYVYHGKKSHHPLISSNPLKQCKVCCREKLGILTRGEEITNILDTFFLVVAGKPEGNF